MKRQNKENWFNHNFKKLTFALALTGALTGTIGLIVGSVGVNKTSTLKYYKKIAKLFEVTVLSE